MPSLTADEHSHPPTPGLELANECGHLRHEQEGVQGGDAWHAQVEAGRKVWSSVWKTGAGKHASHTGTAR